MVEVEGGIHTVTVGSVSTLLSESDGLGVALLSSVIFHRR